MPGPRPKPTHLKLAAGNPGKRALNKDEPQPDKGADMPHWLPEKAKPYWREAYLDLDKCGVVTQLDKDALGLYCSALAEYVEASEMIKAEGLIIKSPTGYPIQNPWVSIRNKAYERMQKLLIEFGMTPSSRSKVKAKPKQGDDKLARFKGKRNAA